MRFQKEKKLRALRRQWAARTIQRRARGMMGRGRVLSLRRDTRAARARVWGRVILCERYLRALWGWHGRASAAATVIQKRIRGLLGRVRVARLRHAAARLNRVARGWLVRLSWGERLRRHVDRRRKAALTLQKRLPALGHGVRARRRVRRIREEKVRSAQLALEIERTVQRVRLAVLLQKRVRGIRDRRKVLAIRKAKSLISKAKAASISNPIDEMESSVRPALSYYEMRSRYLQSQNQYFREQVRVIQRHARGMLARRRVRNILRARAASVLQFHIRLFLLRARARHELSRRRALKARRLQAAITIQRMGRGLLVRTVSLRIMRSEILKWFLKTTKKAIRVALAIQSVRLLQRLRARRLHAVRVIQALARGRRDRKWVKKNRRKLLREKAARLKEKRLRACVRLQCFLRRALARRAVGRRRLAREEERRAAREWEELEKAVDGRHGEFLLELLAIRMETGARGMMARKLLMKKIAAAKEEDMRRAEQKRHSSARMLQALIRGVLARRRHRRNLPQLKRARLARQFCVECEQQIGVRRCRQCKDRYCVSCYQTVHSKGTRKGHTFENVKMPANLAAALMAEKDRQQGYSSSNNNNNNSSNNNNGGSGSGVGRAGGAAAGKRGQKEKEKEWEEFYDSSAKAKYWFNKVTGEASWIKPY